MEDPWKRPTFASSVHYRDAEEAIQWLEAVFQFQRVMIIRDAEGAIVHSEMCFRGDGMIMIGGEWTGMGVSPQSADAHNTQRVHVHMDDGIDEHCAHVRGAGAEIVREPSDEFYGDRVYIARDLEGHLWTFSQTVREVSKEEAEEASGFTIEGWLPA